MTLPKALANRQTNDAGGSGPAGTNTGTSARTMPPAAPVIARPEKRLFRVYSANRHEHGCLRKRRLDRVMGNPAAPQVYLVSRHFFAASRDLVMHYGSD